MGALRSLAVIRSIGSMRWLVLWLVLTLVYLAVDLPLRALAGEPWPPTREALLALAVIPLIQVGAIRFVLWMRRSVRSASEAGKP